MTDSRSETPVPEGDIGRAVREFRMAKGLGQTDLAMAMKTRGIKWSQPTVVAVEKGERPLRHSEALALADLTGFTASAELPGDYLELLAFKRRVMGAINGRNEA